MVDAGINHGDTEGTEQTGRNLTVDERGYGRDEIGLVDGSDVTEEIYKEARKGGREEVKVFENLRFELFPFLGS